MSLPQGLTIQYGDTAMFIGKDRKVLIRTVLEGDKLQTHLGQILFDDIVGEPYGEQFPTHIGNHIYALPPNLDDFLTHIKRETQIIYPKDLGYIALKLALREGMHVIEAGTGSGALTSVLALMVGESGHVYSYDRREKSQKRAIKNVQRLGVDHRVTFYHQNIDEGFHQTDAHALFLDLPDAHDYLDLARGALRSGGFFGAIVPTVNQMIELLSTLYHGRWFLLQSEEIMLRTWKTIPSRVRPDDSMVGHTGFLVFARAVNREPAHLREREKYSKEVAQERNEQRSGDDSIEENLEI